MRKNVHFLGIGGSGASAAAAIAQAQGFEVTGCDLEPVNEFTTPFQTNQLLKGHSASHTLSGKVGPDLIGVDILAVTPAIFSLDPENPELLEAKKKNIPILTWQQFLGKYLIKDKFVIAVCGTHGKTTTSAMIGLMLEDADLDPTVILGAIVPKWGSNYRIGRGKYFVVEADEFNDNFLPIKPDIAVVTNIEMDHPEYFKDFSSYKESFRGFLLQTKGTIVANLADREVAEVLKDVMKQTGVTCFDYSNNHYKLKLQIPGQFNESNATAAFQIGILLNIDSNLIRKSLEDYKGVGRRFEYLGNYQGAKVYTDFGHHPTEIRETMKAAREKFPTQKIWLIYEPHMFSRTKALFEDFVKVFREIPVDKIIITDIYPSREVDMGLVSSQQLVDAIHSDTSMYQSKSNLLDFLKKEVQSEDILFFMGAGEIDKFARELLS